MHFVCRASYNHFKHNRFNGLQQFPCNDDNSPNHHNQPPDDNDCPADHHNRTSDDHNCSAYNHDGTTDNYHCASVHCRSVTVQCQLRSLPWS